MLLRRNYSVDRTKGSTSREHVCAHETTSTSLRILIVLNMCEELTARSMEMRASWGFIVRLYRASQISLTGRFSQVWVSINPRHIFRSSSSVFSQDQTGTSSSRWIILRQSMYHVSRVWYSNCFLRIWIQYIDIRGARKIQIFHTQENFYSVLQFRGQIFHAPT